MFVEPTLGATPEIVGKADCRDRRDGRTVREPDLPADERQPQAAEVQPERATGVEGVAQLTCPVHEPAQIATCRAVAERQLDLANAQAPARGVDGHPNLAAESGGDREAG